VVQVAQPEKQVKVKHLVLQVLQAAQVNLVLQVVQLNQIPQALLVLVDQAVHPLLQVQVV
jgi:hypothetical protein